MRQHLLTFLRQIPDIPENFIVQLINAQLASETFFSLTYLDDDQAYIQQQRFQVEDMLASVGCGSARKKRKSWLSDD